jgi:hypothetical protein
MRRVTLCIVYIDLTIIIREDTGGLRRRRKGRTVIKGRKQRKDILII